MPALGERTSPPPWGDTEADAPKANILRHLMGCEMSAGESTFSWVAVTAASPRLSVAAWCELALDTVVSCNVTDFPVPLWCRVMPLIFQRRAGPCLSPEKLHNRTWVLSFPSRSKNHLIAIIGEGMSSCGAALMGGAGTRAWAESPNIPHSLAGQTGSGFGCSHRGDRARCPFLWPGKVVACGGVWSCS